MGEESPRRYRKCPEEQKGGGELVRLAANEFPEPLDIPATQVSRRGFLKAAGFTVAAATLAGCSRAPVEKAIPYLIQPEEIIPGRSYYYASTCAACAAGCGVLVKDRDGRPIKLEGNPDHPLSRGGLCAVGQASLLGLYDSLRLKQPLAEGRPAGWGEVDRRILARLEDARSAGGAVRFLSGTITSPTLAAMIRGFLGRFGDARHIAYDALSSSAILDAHAETHGSRILPRYRFDRAEVIASFDADFLGTWISPVEFAAEYRAGRDLGARPARMSYHVQCESRMSLTGAKADRRVPLAPSELAGVMEQVASRVASRAGISYPGEVAPALRPELGTLVEDLAQRLWQTRGRSLIVCGAQDVSLQILANFLNHVLGNYGSTLDLEAPSYQRQGCDRDLARLLDELRDQKVSALFVYGANPVYDLPFGHELADHLKRVPLVVSLSERRDETSGLAHYVCPDHHFLESWGDAEAVSGLVSLYQPAIRPFGSTRSVLESLAAWKGESRPAYDIVREHWRANVFPRQRREKSFDAFWDRSLQAGFAEVEPERIKPKPFRSTALRASSKLAPAAAMDSLALVLYAKVAMLDGRHAHNAWLQELPDPISKVAWDNYACLSPATAARLGVTEADVVRIEVSDSPGSTKALELPVFLQPGQHDAIVAVALGYGREGTERFSKIRPRWLFARPTVGENGLVGKNAAPMIVWEGDTLRYVRKSVRVVKTGRKFPLASTQSHYTLAMPKNLPVLGGERRDIVREMSVAGFLKQSAAAQGDASEPPNGLWPADHPYTGHRWGMVIDLTACTGCSACVVACQAENNIPVVGKDEVRRHREMHWIRLDRYYSGGREIRVAHQPMLCQQCDNAPCETVCPVLATVHSSEGLNQQVYNRCVGTRYCENNCPYKVRRFNWFDYPRQDRLQNLALNPDVTVRSRGVMEKCTFCVQRIQEAKIEAMSKGVPLADGQIQPACQQSCPAQAIVFGDVNDPYSRVSRMARDPRHYGVLEEMNFRPAVKYLALVRNRKDEGEERNG